MAAAGDRHWWYRATRQLLDDLAGPHLPPVGPDTLYLDAAGGTGATGRWLARRAATVVLDIEPVALQVAAAAHPNHLAVCADLNALPHADGSFDAVLCVTALCHQLVPDPAEVVGEFARLTRPGGVVCLMEPGVRRLRRGHDVVTHTARRFSRGDLADLVTGAGLELVRSTGAYSFLVPPAALLALAHRGRTGEGTSDVGRHQSGLGGVFGALAAAERALLRRRSLPAGLSVIAIGRRPGD